MAGLIFGRAGQAGQQPQITGVMLQTSVAGAVIPIIFGATRVAMNLIWLGDFVTIPGQNTGGKGGVLAGGKHQPGQTTYQTALIGGVCEGPISGIGTVYADKNLTTLSALGLTLFTGSYSQTAWGYIASAHPDQALGYRGLAYLAAQSYQLGTTATLPNHNFEVFGLRYNAVGTADADASLVVTDILTNVTWGSSWPAGYDFTNFQKYSMASGFLISPAYTTQRPAMDMLQEISVACNSDWLWSNAILSLVPRGDASVTGNGFTYTPPSTPEFDLTDDDFCPDGDGEPVIRNRLRPADQVNIIKREFLDRTNRYNPATVDVRDQAAVDLYGPRPDASSAVHLFCLSAPARLSAQLELQRQTIRNIYQFRLDSRYACLDPTDIVTITQAGLGLDRQWVKIRQIDEDYVEGEGFYYRITAEEYLNGSGSAAAYNLQATDGYAADYNSVPDNAAVPVIIEPPIGLVNDPEVWIGVAGGGPNWSSGQVWIATDGENYRYIGTITQSASMGVLTADLPAVTKAAIGPTIDNTSTLSVDLLESGAILVTTSVADALAYNTLCYVGGEYLAFANANLTGTAEYDLTYLVRGLYGTDPDLVASGQPFLQIDDGVLKVPVTADRVGQTLYVKILSSNLYGGGLQSLGEVSAYTYTIVGASIVAPLPVVENFRTAFVDGKMWMFWDEVDDPRLTVYEIRKGSTWESGQVLGRVAHPPVPVYGDDTYWVSAFNQAAPDLTVYSLTPTDLSVQGSALVINVIASWDEEATGWSGTKSTGIISTGSFIRTSSTATSGTYTIPSTHQIAIGRVAPCPLSITWNAVGQYNNADFLSLADVLGSVDFLGASATALIGAFPEYRLSQDNGGTWGSWLKYAPGVYLASKFDARLQLEGNPDAGVSAYASAFVFTVDAPDRVDYYPSVATSTSGDSTQSFIPYGSTADAPFNGGPGASTTPAVSYTIRNASAGDDVVVSSLSLSKIVFSVFNGGSRVSRNVGITAQGY